MHIVRLFRKYRNWFAQDLEKPGLVFAKWHKNKDNYYPSCIVGDLDKSTKTVPLYFLHKEEEKDVSVEDIIYHHSNLMMMKASFCRRGKIYCGTVYGNDSPKYDGEPRTFFIRLSKKEMVSVPVKNVFLSKRQAKKVMFCYKNHYK